MNEYLNVIRNNYANSQGRARRREYFTFALVNLLILLVLELPIMLLTGQVGTKAIDALDPSIPLSTLQWASLILTFLYLVAIIVPVLAIGVRRLHDTGKSGWWYLVTLIPFIGSLVLLVLTVLDSESSANK